MKTYTIEYNLLGTYEIEAEDAGEAREKFNELALSDLYDDVSDCEISDVYAVV